MVQVTIGANGTLEQDFGEADVVIEGPVCEGARIVLSARSVTFRDRIDDADVTIDLCGGDLVVEGRIDGTSRLRVRGARGITLHDKVDCFAVLHLHAESPIEVKGKVGGGSEIHYWAPHCAFGGEVRGGARHVRRNWGGFPDHGRSS